MAQTFGTFKSIADQRDREAIARAKAAAANLDDNSTPIADAAKLPVASHQERVNAEMFKAMEILGRKIDRAFDEREHLTRRLALIESAATVDEKTGKLYLPVIAEGMGAAALPAPPAMVTVPRWMVVTTLLSTAIAIAALAIVALRPVTPALTAEQIAILDALAQTRMGALSAPLSGTATPESWQSVDTAQQQIASEAAVQETLDATAPPQDELQYDAAPAEATVDAVIAPQQSSPVQDILTGTEQTTVDEGAMTPAPQAVTEPAPVIAETPADPIVIPGEEIVAATPPAQEEAPVALAPPPPPAAVASKPVVEKPVEKPAPVTAAAEKPSAPPPLVAGLDIGRDSNLPADLISVETRAMEGVAAAQHDLATIYAAGKQTKQDYKRAAYWFAQAAEGGIANAHYNLGVMFQQGLGLRKDSAKAMDWYKKAADLGHPEAMYNLGIAYIEGVGTTRNVDKGIEYFQKASNAGVAQAGYNLGVLYESGFAGPIDLANARTWYENASKQGHTEAREALARLEKQLGQGGAPATLTPADMVEPAAGDSAPQAQAPQPAAQKKSVAYKNDLVGKDQRALIGRGLLPASAATGQMDPRTEDAIRAFQQSNNLPVDGIPSLTLLGQINETTR